MFFLRKIALISLAVVVLAGCKSKKKISLSGEEPVAASDFIGFFQPVTLSWQYADEDLQKKEKDSLLISYKIFTQFVPDSVISKVFGKGVKPKIYALGKAQAPGAETYLFVKTVANEKKAILILGFDKKQQFISAMAALRPDNNSTTLQSVSMDRKYTITKTIQQKNKDGSISEGKDVYILNIEGKNFMLIMTDPLNDKITELINPIDTLTRNQKFTADYGTGNMNLVSIRDGRKSDRLSFFIHFEKNSGECIGELKGEAFLKSPNRAEYREAGDPCILQFIFSSTSVSLQEENCGSRRSPHCVFDGSFRRKKWIKPTAPKQEKKVSAKPVKK